MPDKSKQVHCAECGELIDQQQAESCDHCNIYLCDGCFFGHDCDGWQSLTPADRRIDRERRAAWQAEQEGSASNAGK